MQKDERSHLDAFCEYLKHNGLDDALREHGRGDFAKGYNGPEYWKNNYDIKLEQAYDKHSREESV